MDRYDNQAAFGDRATGKMLRQEGQTTVKEADGMEQGQGSSNRLTMGLTKPIFQPSTSYQKYKNSLPPQVSQFQGFQRLTKISPKNSSTDMRNFNFLLSNVNNDNHHDKTGNLQQNMSYLGCSQLSCLQPIQDKMNMCRASSSSQMTPPKMTQAEEKSCNTWKNIRKSYVQKKMPVRKVLHFVPDLAPERKRTTPINTAYTIRKSRVCNSVHTWPYKDRVIHLLALKDYKKSELLVQLQKDGIKIIDNNFLGKILLQVANLNATTLSYTLKDSVFKEVQRDWPGYSEEDKKSLDLVLSRKVGRFHNATKDTNCQESTVASSTNDLSSSKDHYFHLAGIETLTKNKVGMSPPNSSVQSTSYDYLNSNSEKSLILPSSAATTKYVPTTLSTAHLPMTNSPLLVKSNRNVCSAPERPGTQQACDRISRDSRISEREMSKHTSLEVSPSLSVQTKNTKTMEVQHFMPEKFKCTFAKRKTSIPNYHIYMTDKQKICFGKQDESANSNSNKAPKKVFADSGKNCSVPGIPECLANYSPIVSSEQRQCYEKEFREDYNEYQAMYEKFQISCTPIIDLDSERKIFSPGSKEYQDITKIISVEYQKMRQINPNFCEERDRCVFLYNKLLYLKKLINDFDQEQEKEKQ